MHNLNTITVTKKFFSKYRTIQSAVNHAQPGDTIVLEPGKYKEQVIIKKLVSIVGNGEKGEVVFSGNIHAETNLIVKNITFNPEYSTKTQVSLRVVGGKTIVEDCLFMNVELVSIFADYSDASLYVKNTTFTEANKGIEVINGASLVVEDSKFINLQSNGVVASKNATANIQRCLFQGIEYPSVFIAEEAEVTVEDSKIHSGSFRAVDIANAKGIFINSEIYENEGTQIFVDNGEAIIEDCQIYNGGEPANGILAKESEVKIKNSTIHNHQRPQIFAEKAKILIKETKIFDSPTSNGIRMIDESEVILFDCDIYKHGDYPQISVEESSKIHLVKSRIFSNDGAGIIFEKAGKGIIEECSIYDNGWRQVNVDEESDVKLIRTKIYSGKEETNGIIVTGASTTEIVGCAISDHEYPQLFIDEKSNFHMRESKIFDGRDSCGMRILDATGSIERCEFTNNGQYPHIVIEQQSEVKVLGSQIHSGQGLGIVVNNAKGIIHDCDIYNNEHIQLQIEDGAYAEVNSCRIYDGHTHGIRISSGARATIQDVSIFGHRSEYAQVVVKEGGNPIFQRCKVFDGAGDGFFFIDKGIGTIEDCYVYNNADSNFLIVKDSAPILRRNRILNGKFGVYVEEANPIIENCIFNDHLYEDFYFDENSNPALIENEFNSIGKREGNQGRQQSQASKYEEILGFNPYEMDLEELKVRLMEEKRKWINRMNAPNIEKRQEAERALMLIEELEKELYVG